MWLAVDIDGIEYLFEEKPWKDELIGYMFFETSYLQAPKGTIKRLIGRELTWNDEPVEVTEYK